MLAKLPNDYILVRVGASNKTFKMIQNMGLQNRVILKKDINILELADIYRGSDVLIFPSLFEGFGIPLIEAMASGTSVITSNRGSLPEVVGEAGIIADPFDVDFMSENIQVLLETEKGAQKYIDNVISLL